MLRLIVCPLSSSLLLSLSTICVCFFLNCPRCKPKLSPHKTNMQAMSLACACLALIHPLSCPCLTQWVPSSTSCFLCWTAPLWRSRSSNSTAYYQAHSGINLAQCGRHSQLSNSPSEGTNYAACEASYAPRLQVPLAGHSIAAKEFGSYEAHQTFRAIISLTEVRVNSLHSPIRIDAACCTLSFEELLRIFLDGRLLNAGARGQPWKAVRQLAYDDFFHRVHQLFNEINAPTTLQQSFTEYYAGKQAKKQEKLARKRPKWTSGDVKNGHSQRGVLSRLGTRDGLIARLVPPHGGTLRVMAGSLARTPVELQSSARKRKKKMARNNESYS